MGGVNNPLVVAQYLDETNNSSYGGAKGVILTRKYVDPLPPFVFGSSIKYNVSYLRTYLETDYWNNCSEEAKTIISSIPLPWWNGSSMETIDSNFFAMGVMEVCAVSSSEGIMWDLWKEKTGFTAPNQAANNGRIPKSSSGAAQYVWLRSDTNENYVWIIAYDGSVTNVLPSNTAVGVMPACFISFEETFDMPDLSQPLDRGGLVNLSKIVQAGKASEYLKQGDTLLIPYGSHIMPFEITGFRPAVCEVNGQEATYSSINLLSQYTLYNGSTWGDAANTKYSASNLRTYITTTAQESLDQSFIECLGFTRVQTYSRDGSIDKVYDKLYAPSMDQLGVANTANNSSSQAAVEGPVFTAYQNATNDMRIRRVLNTPTVARAYWTRSLYASNSEYFGNISTVGSPYYSRFSVDNYIVLGCDFIGFTTETST